MITKMLAFYKRVFLHHSEGLHSRVFGYGLSVHIGQCSQTLGRRGGQEVDKNKDELEAAGMSHSVSNSNISQVVCLLPHAHLRSQDFLLSLCFL